MGQAQGPRNQITRLSASILKKATALNQLVEESRLDEAISDWDFLSRNDSNAGDAIFSSLASRIARQLYRERRERDKVFGADLFGEPAWDILLSIFIAEEAGRISTVGSTSTGACVPTTTALRYINALIDQGRLIRSDDPMDKRRATLQLSPKLKQSLTHYLESLAESWSPSSGESTEPPN